MRNKFLLVILCMFLACCGCKRKPDRVDPEKEYRATREALVGVNRMMVKKDHERIKAYAIQNNLPLNESLTGLWYMVDGKGKGETAQAGQVASLRYRISLLDGTSCYSSDSLGIKNFRIGQGGVESGLEEGILLMRAGDKATFIMPPHLAHGLTGDGDRIPARAILVYEVELIKLDP